MDVLNNNNNTIQNNIANQINSKSEICGFFKDANVFITGGTGFLGKVLIEKLLRSTEANIIYLLIRKKRGKDMETRIDELLADSIFDRVKSEVPKCELRVRAISGDCALAGLGISIQDRKLLQGEIQVVFHVAASINFNMRLDLAYDINVNGTKAIVELCRQMTGLKSFIHISTAYSNCHLKKIEEKFYDYQMRYTDIEMMLAKLDAQEVERITPRILGEWPNTYAFTKAMAETVIRESCDGLPVGVFRPAIVTSTNLEPIPGWTDNLFGPTGLVAAGSTGVMRTMFSDDKLIANVVPVDTCVAGIIASAWDVGTRTVERISDNIPIYNYVSSVENPITWGEHNLLNELAAEICPMSSQMWKIGVYTTTNPFHYNLAKFFYHLVPAAFMDVGFLFMGQRPRMIKLYNKIHTFTSAVSYFSTSEFDFTNNQVQDLYKRLSPYDKILFPMSMRNIHWLEYYRRYLPGIRQYLLKDPIQTIPAAFQKRNRLHRLHFVIKYSLLFLAGNIMWSSFLKLTAFLMNVKYAVFD